MNQVLHFHGIKKIELLLYGKLIIEYINIFFNSRLMIYLHFYSIQK